MVRAKVAFLAVLLAGWAATADAAGTRRVTVMEGTNFAAAPSPDGRSIVLDLQGELRLLPATGGAAVVIPGFTGEARLPAWSPDGKRIAFQGYQGGYWHIYVVRPDGTGLRQITAGSADDREPTWSTDGRTILFSSDRAGNFDVWRTGLNDREPVQVTTGEVDESQPVQSPADGSIAFVADTAKGQELRVMAAGGATRTILSTADEIALPSWTADGKSVAAVVYMPGRVGRASRAALQRVDLATNAVTAVSAPGEDVFIGRAAWGAGDVLYTADGGIRRRSTSGVATIPMTAEFRVRPAGDYRRHTPGLAASGPEPAKGILRPVVSPDGKRIAFTALGDLWLLTIGDPKPVRLTDDPFVDIEPAWSPDGSKLAYTSDRRGAGTMDLYLRDMRTGREERLTDTSESVSAPVFSPDGRRIALTVLDSSDWHANIPHVLDLETRELRKIHDWLFKPSVASWSRGGDAVSYVSLEPKSQRFRHGLNEILTIPVDGGPPRFTTPTPGRTLGIRAKAGAMLSPDGRRLAFVQDGVLWTAPVGPGGAFGKPRRLTRELADEPSWTGDSQTIVFLATDRLKRVHVADGRVEDIPLRLDWSPVRPTGRTVVQAGRLFDGKTLSYRTSVDIVIDGNVITEVVPRRASWPDARIIDATKRTVMPGMFENHIHNFIVNGEQTGRIALSFGITSIREPGADPSEAVETREAWASGRRAGPRLFTTGLIEGPRLYYPMSLPVTSRAVLDLELERAARLDYDFIKTYERLDSADLQHVVEWAHRRGIPVTSHDLYPAATFGVDAIEHLVSGDRIIAGDRLSLTARLYDDVLQLYVASGVAVVPTAVGGNPAVGAFYLRRDGKAFADLKQLRLLPQRVRASRYLRSAIAGEGLNDPSAGAAADNPIGRLKAAGVALPPGTDTSFFNLGFGIVAELRYYVDQGFTPGEALRAATLDSARLNRVEDRLGSLEPGKLADLVVVDGDPLADVLDVLNVDLVMKDGRPYRFDELAAGANLGAH
ncbi:LpqB family beta-propeller domain-containing protein [Phenylobacterium sp.]|uniref:amidohydrolase family protein n=1 Tax=Phenylobacterium sp. TaxID=1871053 RepID=UPI0025CDBA48|nr:LpqB family beta-propeller domain-containing protein [Phenylobacterium sp.]